MDATLEGLLKAIDMGDADAIGILADWLEERGDARCSEVRAATVPDLTAIARTLMDMRHGEHLQHLADQLEIGWQISVEVDPLLHTLWEQCRTDVEQALATRKLSNELARAIRVTRRAKIDELLQLFKEASSAS